MTVSPQPRAVFSATQRYSRLLLATVLTLSLALTGCAVSRPQAILSRPTAVKEASASASGAHSFSEDSTQSGVPPAVAEVTAAVEQLVHEHSASVRLASVENIKMARDQSGRWWVSAVGVPAASAHLDPVTVYMYEKGRRWVLFDLGTGIDPSELPADVRGRL